MGSFAEKQRLKAKIEFQAGRSHRPTGGGAAIPSPFSFWLLKDKLFFFADAERIKQDAANSATTSSVFTAIQQQYPVLPSRFRDTYTTGRIDYNAPHGIHLFARAFYEPNADDSNYNYLYSICQLRSGNWMLRSRIRSG